MSKHTKRQVNELFFQHAFYSHVYRGSLRYISYQATMAREKEYLIFRLICNFVPLFFARKRSSATSVICYCY